MLAGAATAQTKIARTADGKPDLNGIWQAMGSAHWNLEPHNAEAGPVVAMGALGAIPGGLGVVEGGRIPYKPEAARQRAENKAKWLELDPLVKCYLPGVPRATYLPHPFQIVQEPNTLLMTYEFAGADRIVYMNKPGSASTRRFVDGLQPRALGRRHAGHRRHRADAGDTGSTAPAISTAWGMKVQERYTPAGVNVLMYEATITDPEVFTRPWKISMPLYRRLDRNMQLLDFKCVEFVEELLYGKYRKGAQ